ncbi:hypothetical protein ACFLV5_02310 [Chloroflexota bacterium]
MEEVVIVSTVRTPIGSYGGSLKDLSAYDLGTLVLAESAKRAKINPPQVDLVILAQSYQSGEYVNLARMCLLKAGWPIEIPGITIDCRCC